MLAFTVGYVCLQSSQKVTAGMVSIFSSASFRYCDFWIAHCQQSVR